MFGAVKRYRVAFFAKERRAAARATPPGAGIHPLGVRSDETSPSCPLTRWRPGRPGRDQRRLASSRLRRRGRAASPDAPRHGARRGERATHLRHGARPRGRRSDLFHLAPGYADEELFMADVARALGGELAHESGVGVLGQAHHRPQPGRLPMADSRIGVLDPDGQVYGKPASTCSTAPRSAARSASIPRPPSWPSPSATSRVSSPGIRRSSTMGKAGRRISRSRERACAGPSTPGSKVSVRTPPKPKSPGTDRARFYSKPLGLHFEETMQGYYEPDVPNAGHHDAVYREHETRGRRRIRCACGSR